MSHQQPLQHAYPSMEPPADEPWSDDLREVWRGDMRVVRSKRRMKLLRRRGVPLLKSREGCWLWFVEPCTAIDAECVKCGGAGLVTIFNYDGNGSDADDQPCPECAQ